MALTVMLFPTGIAYLIALARAAGIPRSGLVVWIT
jgi:hypothetical protein